MQVETREAVGIVGLVVGLTIQDCIVLKSLSNDLKMTAQHLDSEPTPVSDLMNRTSIFLDKITIGVHSLQESEKSLFEEEAEVEENVKVRGIEVKVARSLS